MPRMLAPTPILRSFDEAATRAFYIDFLGFMVEFEHRFEPDAPSTFPSAATIACCI